MTNLWVRIVNLISSCKHFLSQFFHKLCKCWRPHKSNNYRCVPSKCCSCRKWGEKQTNLFPFSAIKGRSKFYLECFAEKFFLFSSFLLIFLNTIKIFPNTLHNSSKLIFYSILTDSQKPNIKMLFKIFHCLLVSKLINMLHHTSSHFHFVRNTSFINWFDQILDKLNISLAFLNFQPKSIHRFDAAY